MQTWLIVAAEALEFQGILKRAKNIEPLHWPDVAFARQCRWNGDRWLLAANGPGPNLVDRTLKTKHDVDGMMSIGFCGALDSALVVGDIVVSGDVPNGVKMPFVRGTILSIDRVVVTAEEKRALHSSTGASAVEMESAAVEKHANKWNVPFRCVRVISDTASQNMPLDFNLYRDSDGRFSRPRIAVAGLARPFTALPALMRLDRNCKYAAERLGEFLADCQF